MKKRHITGFTLLEMMVTVAIIGILAMLAAPSFTRMLANSKVRENLNTWQSSFFYAQQEALRRKQVIEFCASETGTSCSGSKNFNEGWIVWYTDSAGQQVILQDVVPPDTEINMVINESANGCVGELCFWRNGRLPPSYRGGTLTFTSTNPNLSNINKRLVINSAGRLKGE